MNPLITLATITFFIYLSPIFFILADLWAGIRKAKERGEVITSYKTRRTIYKVCRYYNALIALSVLDGLQIGVLYYGSTYHGWHSVLFPFITLLGAIGIGLIECKSILEPANAKERKQAEQVARLARKLMESKDDPIKAASAISEFITNEKDK